MAGRGFECKVQSLQVPGTFSMLRGASSSEMTLKFGFKVWREGIKLQPHGYHFNARIRAKVRASMAQAFDMTNSEACRAPIPEHQPSLGAYKFRV